MKTLFTTNFYCISTCYPHNKKPPAFLQTPAAV